MPYQGKRTAIEAHTPGTFAFLWQFKTWWVFSLAVLLLLLGIIFLLVRLSSADTEMYPTTHLKSSWTISMLC